MPFGKKKRTVNLKTAALFIAAITIISVAAVIVNQSIRSNAVLVNGNTIILGVGQKYNYPIEDNSFIRFKSFDDNIVKVNNKGEFTGVSKGSALVRIGSKDITVYVDSSPLSVKFDEDEIYIGNGEDYTPKFEVEGSSCNIGFKFSSSNSSILSVDNFGKIKGMANGTADLSVETYNGLSATCKVVVKNAPSEIKYPYESKTLYLNTELSLKASLPDGSASKVIKITSDNPDAVKADGWKIIPVSEGEATITAETYNGKTASCKISVLEAPFYIRTNLDASKPMIALSFNDGPNSPSTNSILDTLEQNNASATFFMVDSRLKSEGNAECAKRMIKLGCQIGNHTYSHKKYGKDVTVDEITNCSEIIKSVTGYYPTAFRPTGGFMSDLIKENCGAPICLWSVDTNDWKYRDETKLYDYVIYAAGDGDIILMHDIYSTSAKAVEWFVPELEKRSYQLVNIAELAYYKGSELKNGQTYHSFK